MGGDGRGRHRRGLGRAGGGTDWCGWPGAAGQLDAHACALPAVRLHLHHRANALGALAHDTQAYVQGIGRNLLYLKAHAIILHFKAPARMALHPQFHPRCLGMLAHIRQGFLHHVPHLDLHIVQRLVELMQGRVEVSSAAGLGTRLRVWLPQGQTLQPLPEEAFAPTRSAFGDLEGVAGDQPLTVLYAEDNVVNIELVRQVMRMRPQWRLEVAYCGQDAITMALRDPPDLLLLDMHLGDMSGLDVSNVLTRQPHTAGIPRVALSADVLPDLVREARAQGFVDYLSKPLDVGRLLRLLDRVSQLKAP